MPIAADNVLIIASAWWGAPARLAVALHNAGCRVFAICPPGHPLLHVDSVHAHYHYSCYQPVQALAQALDASQASLVVPTDDRCYQHLHALYARTTDRNKAVLLCSLGGAMRCATLLTRHPALQLAQQLGISVPATRRVSAPHDLASWQEPLPWVLKSSGSWGGSGIRIVQDRSAAVSALASLASPPSSFRVIKRWAINRDGFWLHPWLRRQRSDVIAQRFIAGQPANIAVACWRGEVVASLAVAALRTQGPTGAAAAVRVIDVPEMQTAARHLARRLNLSGLHGLDFILDPDGRAWLIEINPRATQLCHFANPGAASLAARLVAAARGTAMPDQPPAAPGTVIALFPQAWPELAGDLLLATAVQDVPWEQPALMRELLGIPWPNRSRLARFWQAYVRPKAWQAWNSLSAADYAEAPDRELAD